MPVELRDVDTWDANEGSYILPQVNEITRKCVVAATCIMAAKVGDGDLSLVGHASGGPQACPWLGGIPFTF